MTDSGPIPVVGARGYAISYGNALPEGEVPSQEFLDWVRDIGPWTLTEWDGERWVHVARVNVRAELDRWLADAPRDSE
jgi:hypothetical protein